MGLSDSGILSSLLAVAHCSSPRPVVNWQILVYEVGDLSTLGSAPGRKDKSQGRYKLLLNSSCDLDNWTQRQKTAKKRWLQ